MTCDRCGRDAIAFTGSHFNTDVVCLDCKKIERAHPLFEEARRVESEHVARGNYNFEGIGLPPDLAAPKI